MTPDHLRGSVFGNRKIGNTTKITNQIWPLARFCA